MSRALSVLADGGAFFECPRWHDGRWWASDFYRSAVYAYDDAGGEEEILRVDGQASGLGWLPDGDLLVVSMERKAVLRRSAADGSVSVHADVGALCGGLLNDLLVGPDGTAWAGNFGFDLMAGAAPAPAPLIAIAPDGTARVAADDLWFPNGMVLTDDGTLVVAETFAARLTAFTVGDGGALTDRRVFGAVGPTPELGDASLRGATFAPDGCALDAEGHVWAANAVGRSVMRIAPGGAVVDEVAMPDGLRTFACGLGGPGGHTLVACAAPDFLAHKRRDAREALLLSARVDVPGAGLP